MCGSKGEKSLGEGWKTATFVSFRVDFQTFGGVGASQQVTDRHR